MHCSYTSQGLKWSPLLNCRDAKNAIQKLKQIHFLYIKLIKGDNTDNIMLQKKILNNYCYLELLIHYFKPF